MGKDKPTTNALKYLSENSFGDIVELNKKVSEEQIEMIKRSGRLFFKDDKYIFAKEGKEDYAVHYFKPKKSFNEYLLGL